MVVLKKKSKLHMRGSASAVLHLKRGVFVSTKSTPPLKKKKKSCFDKVSYVCAASEHVLRHGIQKSFNPSTTEARDRAL